MPLIELWAFDFMRYALISACLLGPACALLGVFVTLRGMAFFSDALAHSAVTGVALGMLLEERFGVPADSQVSLFVFSLILASLMAWVLHRSRLPADTVIAFSFTGSVALGVVIVSMLGRYRMLDGILFGSIYSNGPADLVKQGILALLIVVLMVTQMRAYLLHTICPEIAQAHGQRTGLTHYGFVLLIAATVAICLKMLGALLLSALVVIPAASGRLVCSSFRGLLIFSVISGFMAGFAGVVASWILNVPTSPCIVLANITVLVCCFFWRSVRS